ncbi:UNVERIFIED_CONTAM: hypothetical protein ABID98_000755 [Brevibacillus sp. OAP136]
MLGKKTAQSHVPNHLEAWRKRLGWTRETQADEADMTHAQEKKKAAMIALMVAFFLDCTVLLRFTVKGIALETRRIFFQLQPLWIVPLVF